MLKPCSELLQIAMEDSHASGREIRLDKVMQRIQSSALLPSIDGPDCTSSILTKVKTPREFDQAASLFSLMTGQDYSSSYTVQPEVKEEWPTAIENLFALVVFLLKLAKAVKQGNEHDNNL